MKKVAYLCDNKTKQIAIMKNEHNSTAINWNKTKMVDTFNESARTSEMYFSVSKSGSSWFLLYRYTTKILDGAQMRYNTKKEAKAAAEEMARNVGNSWLWKNAQSI